MFPFGTEQTRRYRENMRQPPEAEYKGWKYSLRILYEREAILEYSLSFYRQRNGKWYDETRYDSHERKKRGRTLVIGSSERKRREINYTALSPREIDQRIGRYERKYRADFEAYDSRFSCSDATPQEMTDIMDWESLIQEKRIRKPARRGRNGYAVK